jgi:purine-binding chemotaxis protein CheW
MTKTVEAAEQTQFLTFQLADETYAAGILRVKEIIEYEAVTRVPNMPPSFRGVINLRGAVVPVIDLATRFGLGTSTVTKRSCVIILEVENGGERLVMGILADGVSQVIDLPVTDIEPPPAFGTRIHADYLKGLGKIGKKFVLILDMDRVLSNEEVRAIEAQTAGLTAPQAEPVAAS